jgi:hypothetical protein
MKTTKIKRHWWPWHIRNWTRIDFDVPAKATKRELAEEEADRDLQKSPQQLLCDVHEEVLEVLPFYTKLKNGETLTEEERFRCFSALLNSQKRIASMNTRIAFNSGKAAAWTLFIAILSLCVAIYAVMCVKP